MSDPYRLRTKIRSYLPWFLIDLGVCCKGDNCEKAGGFHIWYNKDGLQSACYHCKVIREGQLWDCSRSGTVDANAGPPSVLAEFLVNHKLPS